MNRSRLKVWILTSSIVSPLLYVQSIAAQVIPDATLPAGERSQVSGNPNVQIDGGARRGGNLFHSFSQFSIPTGGSAYFNNAADVRNIFSRVTGGSISNIDGLIRANGTANLFLLNPNGILFGPNASLNIGGSFVATTATAIGFPNGEVFSSDATQPLPSQLLRINPNVLFFNQLAAQSIINQSTANNGTGLQVPAGQSLLLVGGNVQLEGGQITSPGSRVELGAVAGQGIVGLSGTAGDWRLSFPNNVALSDVALSNSALIDVRAGSGGSIGVTARNLSLNQVSRLRAGINDGLGFAGAQAGDIQLDTTETINLADSSEIRNEVRPGGTGNAGNINITTGSLYLTNGGVVLARTYGQGDAGSVNINAHDTVSWNGNRTGVGNIVDQTGIGNAGSINITTGSLSLSNNAELSSVTRGQGNAGSININAREHVSIDGDGTYVFNYVDGSGIGNAGSINITTESLSLTRGSQLISYTAGRGNAADINITTRGSMSLQGGQLSSFTQGDGDAGNIMITAGSLSVTEAGQFNALTFGQGRAGNVKIVVRDAVSFDGVDSDGTASGVLTGVEDTASGQGGDLSITAGSLSLTNGATLSALTLGQGSAGNINITARDAVLLDGSAREGTGIFATVAETGVGNGGTINLRAGSLSIIGEGAIAADTNGQGQGGNINLDVKGTLLLSGGRTAPTGESSRITLGVQPKGNGSGGDLQINAGSLVLTNGGLIKVSTQGQGDAGNIDIRADRTDISGSVPSSGLPSGLFSSSDTTGNAGDITINTQTFRIADAAALSTRSRGDGQGGDITVNAARSFEVINGGQLITTTFGRGQAGSISVNAADQIAIAGSDLNYAARLAKFPNPVDRLVANAISETGAASGLFANTEPNSTGRSGNIQISTETLNIQNQAEVTVSSSGTGSAGSLFVDADRIFLNNQGSIRADTSGGGGNINLRSPLILLRNGSNITTNATGANIPGGNIGIDTRFLVAVPNEDSNISANSEDFRGGNVRINAFSIFGIQPSLVSTPLSDITATGATSALSGTTDVSTAGIDPTSGLVALPTDFVDRSGLIAQGCPANQGNSFVISGRGGLPPTPEQQLDDDANWQDRRRLVANQQVDGGGQGDTKTASILNSQLSIPNSPPLPHTPIIEATGWLITPTGEISLVASTPDPTMQNRLKWSVVCSRGESSK
ncbi:two-partner secretion domain-containing protein [Nostoc sp.]|uniref:two-partner secretion domain-containing protein n=1 Tax=Nostoc sp. TaxID=1180 RepID=UPI002FF68F5D